jgi:hypothetical protein
VALALLTSEDRSSRREATSVTSLEDSTMKSVSDWLSELTWRTSSSVVEMKGLKYLALWLACLPLPTYCSAEP